MLRSNSLHARLFLSHYIITNYNYKFYFFYLFGEKNLIHSIETKHYMVRISMLSVVSLKSSLEKPLPCFFFNLLLNFLSSLEQKQEKKSVYNWWSPMDFLVVEPPQSILQVELGEFISLKHVPGSQTTAFEFPYQNS